MKIRNIFSSFHFLLHLAVALAIALFGYLIFREFHYRFDFSKDKVYSLSLENRNPESGLDFLPPLGLMYLAGYLSKKTDHQIKMIDCALENVTYEKMEKNVIEEKPMVVGITAMTFTLIDVFKTAEIIKKVDQNIKIVLGGAMPIKPLPPRVFKAYGAVTLVWGPRSVEGWEHRFFS